MCQPSAVNETSPSKESDAHAGPDFIDSQPCLIATAAQGVAIQVAAIDILPQLISVTPEGLAKILNHSCSGSNACSETFN